jgi:hypothetical protein
VLTAVTIYSRMHSLVDSSFKVNVRNIAADTTERGGGTLEPRHDSYGIEEHKKVPRDD